MARLLMVLSAVAGAAGVLLGAFGAHALRSRLTPDLMEVWQTAVQYHLWHALALMGVGLLLFEQPGSRWIAASGWAFLTGVIIFSGSLYLLSLTGVRWLGAITPLGGLSLIAGWVLLAVGAWRAF